MTKTSAAALIGRSMDGWMDRLSVPTFVIESACLDRCRSCCCYGGRARVEKIPISWAVRAAQIQYQSLPFLLCLTPADGLAGQKPLHARARNGKSSLERASERDRVKPLCIKKTGRA